MSCRFPNSIRSHQLNIKEKYRHLRLVLHDGATIKIRFDSRHTAFQSATHISGLCIIRELFFISIYRQSFFTCVTLRKVNLHRNLVTVLNSFQKQLHRQNGVLPAITAAESRTSRNLHLGQTRRALSRRAKRRG